MTGSAGTTYLGQLAERLATDGCETHNVDWGSPGLTGPALVGRRSDFRFRWFATRLHLFTVAGTTERIDLPAIQSFTEQVLDHAAIGVPLGAQVGVAAFPALVSDQVDDAALRWAAEKQRVRFARMARPVVVDTRRGIVAAFRGNALLGWAYAGHLRRKLGTYFPPGEPVP